MSSSSHPLFISPMPSNFDNATSDYRCAPWSPQRAEVEVELSAPRTTSVDPQGSSSVKASTPVEISSYGASHVHDDLALLLDSRPTPRALFHDIPVEDISLYRSQTPEKKLSSEGSPSRSSRESTSFPTEASLATFPPRKIHTENLTSTYTPLFSSARPAASALYGSGRSSQDRLYTSSPGFSDSRSSSVSGNNKNHLVDLARNGDMRSIERLALDLARLARQGDSDAVLELLQSSGDPCTVSSLSSILSGLSTEVGDKNDVTFSPHITTIRRVTQASYAVEHVPSGLTDTPHADQACMDAQLLISLTQPLLEASGARSPANGLQSFTAELSHAECRVLMDALLAVCHHVKKITVKEPRLLEVPSPCYVLGDIHGNLSDLEFFRSRIWPNDAQATAGDFLFLGDFVDRGLDSIPVVAYIMAMKVLNPNKWWLIRGNHETREVNGNVEHYQGGSFLTQCLQAFGDHDGHIVWEAVNTFFDTLPLAATIDNSIFCVHGGIPRELCTVDGSLDLIKRVECPLRSAQNHQMVYDMLWSDPSTPEQENGQELDRGGFGMSPRGCSCFGERSMEAFLAKYNFQHVFRGHEAQKSGVGVSKSARLTTIFSTSRDHFPAEVPATCGCVLVDHGNIRPIVRSMLAAQQQQQQSMGLLIQTHVQQSVEATDMYVLGDQAMYARTVPASPTMQQQHHRVMPDPRGGWVYQQPSPQRSIPRPMYQSQQGYSWAY